MVAGIAILGLAALGLAAAASRRGRRGSVINDAPADVCGWSHQRAARATEPERFAWLGCDGRTPGDAALMVARVRRDDAAAAMRAEERWNAIRAVASAPPDGALTTPEAVNEARAVDAGTMPDAPVGDASLTEARRLVGPTIRALRARSNYRSVLRDFQRAAGLRVDGEYGPESRDALTRLGGQPPALWGRGARAERTMTPNERAAAKPDALPPSGPNAIAADKVRRRA